MGNSLIDGFVVVAVSILMKEVIGGICREGLNVITVVIKILPVIIQWFWVLSVNNLSDRCNTSDSCACFPS